MGMLLHGARTVHARSVHSARTVQCFWNAHPIFYFFFLYFRRHISSKSHYEQRRGTHRQVA